MAAFDIETEAQRIVRALANVLKVGSDSLCFCGSGGKYADCCNKKSGRELAFSKKSFEAVLKYRDSQGGTVDTIPLGLFKLFDQASTQRLPCLHPRCLEPAISCHLIPENILRSNFGGHCLEYRLQDGSRATAFLRTGVGQAGTARVFCSRHDNCLFQELDDSVIDVSSQRQLFLLAFKVIAFSLRRVQLLLGIDFQVAVFRPWLISSRPNLQRLGTVEIDISHFGEQYLRFTIGHDWFNACLEALEARRWDYFSYFHRSIKNQVPMFFADFMNPSHDLNGNRANFLEAPIGMTCNLWTEENQLHVAFACPEGPSRICYARFMEQLRTTDDATLVIVMNNLLTSASNHPLLPSSFRVDQTAWERIRSLEAKAARCLKSSSNEVFDLTEAQGSVSFIQ